MRSRLGRRRSFAVVEAKSFEFEWWNNSSGGDEVSLTERGRRGVFKCTTSVGGARWLANYLCQVSLVEENDNNPLSFWDDHVKIIGSTRNNDRGTYVHLLLISKKNDRRPKTMCFPAGGREETYQTSIQRQSQPPIVSVHGRNRAWETSTPSVRISSNCTVTNSSWWSSTVLCTVSRGVPNWSWVKQKILLVFTEAGFSTIEDGGAIVLFNREEEANKLAKMPPLISWEGEISFKKWNPEVGSFPIERMQSKEVLARFVGVPLHLRTKTTAESLARVCGNTFEVIEESLDWTRTSIKVKVQVSELGRIPRIINLEERGYVFPIWVVLELDGSSLNSNFVEAEGEKEDEVEVLRIGVVNVDQSSPQNLPCQQYSNCQVEDTTDTSRPPVFEEFQSGDLNISNFEFVASANPNSPPIVERQMGSSPFSMLRPATDDPQLMGANGDGSCGLELHTTFQTHGQACGPNAPSELNTGQHTQAHGSRRRVPTFPWSNAFIRWKALQRSNKRRTKRKAKRGFHRSHTLVSDPGPGIDLSTQNSCSLSSTNSHLIPPALIRELTLNPPNLLTPSCEEGTMSSMAVAPASGAVVSGDRMFSIQNALDIDNCHASMDVSVLANRLYNCQNLEDLSDWVKFMVVPIARNLGISSRMNNARLEKLFGDLLKENLHDSVYLLGQLTKQEGMGASHRYSSKETRWMEV
ncbi:hypothetical protein IFM89_005508 [Coptis chinensis]|uniref:DUF4283 domain-containing protein n=1 Tax=Coptis chinensis TaxID=261450 RepID=A0A835GUG3_9MAGN|nr:hypothetical protein IFM89_005508 [Coptis chinensis]